VRGGSPGHQAWIARLTTRTLKLTLAYDGTALVGWQRQAEGESVQGLLEGALATLEGAAVTVHGAGRTDAGVHARGQVASARVTVAHDHATLIRALNAHLPADVRVLAVEDVAADFHARFSATGKHYEYLVRNAAVVLPFERRYVWHLPERLDVEAMRAAAALLVGTHDFSAFRSVGTAVADAVRTITHSAVVRRDGGGLLAYEVAGTGFLRHMVRAIAGTLVEVGRGQRPAQSIPSLLAGRDRSRAGATAPPHGLFLVRVVYD
jgi:tRNA pseudouridine38-40 synthase